MTKEEKQIAVIGLTGGTGSGKSSAARMLAKLGGYVIDADEISREVMMPGGAAYGEVIAVFGSGILDEVGRINRKTLAGIVFSNPISKKKLEELTHKHILLEIKARISKIKSMPGAYEFIVLDAPLLIESGLHRDVDTVWLMRAHEDERKRRVIARDLLSMEQALQRVANQTAFDELIIYADEVIDNDGDLECLERRVEELYSDSIRPIAIKRQRR